MRKAVLFTLVMLISAVCLQVQAVGQSSGKPAPTTIQGCLQFTDGRYILTESNGTFHRLYGEANKLTHQVGHEVQITGTPGVRTTDTTQQGQESSAQERPVFQVKTVKQVADTCSSGK